MKQDIFICTVCRHELPIAYQHDEMSGVCYLDYVSPRDLQHIREVLAEEATHRHTLPFGFFEETLFVKKGHDHVNIDTTTCN